MSDAEDEVEEDPRIAQLYNFASKRYDDDGKYTGEPQEIVDYVAKLGTDKAIVHGSMMLNPAVARAYFIVMALVDADGEDEPTISECLTLRRTALKALVAAGGADAAQMLRTRAQACGCRGADAVDARAPPCGSVRLGDARGVRAHARRAASQRGQLARHRYGCGVPPPPGVQPPDGGAVAGADVHLGALPGIAGRV